LINKKIVLIHGYTKEQIDKLRVEILGALNLLGLESAILIVKLKAVGVTRLKERQLIPNNTVKGVYLVNFGSDSNTIAKKLSESTKLEVTSAEVLLDNSWARAVLDYLSN